MKRVFIIHGWGGNPDEPVLIWLDKQLSEKGLEVIRPAMPNPEKPKIEPWVNYLSQQVGTPDEETFFIGHSIGCQTILRYLESIKTKVGGTIFIAPWLTLKPSATAIPEDMAIARPWLETPIDFAKIRTVLPKLFAVFSDNDEYVPVDNERVFQDKLEAKTQMLHNRGHFSQGEGITEIPELLPEVVNMIE